MTDSDPQAPDSDLYEAMGYVRKSERKSGLLHKSKDDKSKDDQQDA